MIEKKIKKNYDLTSATTFRIGGKAQFFVNVQNKRELIEAIKWSKIKKLPVLFLAGGSNILATSKKIRGLVIRISGQDYFIRGNTISAWAGTGLTALAKISIDHGLSGLEWALGIPGSLGGAVRGNAGAYGSDIAEQVAEVEAYDVVKNKIIKLKNEVCAFSYRHSIFKQRENLLILNVKLKLAKANPDEINNLSKQNFNQRMMSNPKEPSAGCVFKNLEYKKLIKQNNGLVKELEAKGLVRGGKIAVGYLIDQLGLRGKVIGGAKISEKHSNFIINTGGATAEDVIDLINLIKKKVKVIYKINLEEEIQYFSNLKK